MKKLLTLFLTITISAPLTTLILNNIESTNQVDLNTIIETRDLGVISTNNNLGPNKKQLLSAIKSKNPKTINLTTNDFIFKDATTQTNARIIGIGSYKGEVTLNYQTKAYLIARIEKLINSMTLEGFTTNDTTLTVLGSIKNNLSHNDRDYVSLWNSPEDLNSGENNIALSIDGEYYNIKIYAANLPPFTSTINYDFIHIYPYTSSATNDSPIKITKWSEKASTYKDFIRKYSKIEFEGGFTVGCGQPTVDDDFRWEKWKDYGNLSFNIKETKTISWEEESAYTKLTFSISSDGTDIVLNWKGDFKEAIYPSAIWITIKSVKFYN